MGTRPKLNRDLRRLRSWCFCRNRKIGPRLHCAGLIHPYALERREKHRTAKGNVVAQPDRILLGRVAGKGAGAAAKVRQIRREAQKPGAEVDEARQQPPEGPVAAAFRDQELLARLPVGPRPRRQPVEPLGLQPQEQPRGVESINRVIADVGVQV